MRWLSKRRPQWSYLRFSCGVKCLCCFQDPQGAPGFCGQGVTCHRTACSLGEDCHLQISYSGPIFSLCGRELSHKITKFWWLNSWRIWTRCACFWKIFIHVFVAGTRVFSLDTPLSVKSNESPLCLHIVSGSKQRERTVLVSNAVELENVCLI